MLITLLLISVLFIIWFVLKVGHLIQFRHQVNILFKESKKINNQLYTKKQLDNLPEPVQLYFNNVLKDGQPYISYIRVKHDGQFKTGLHKPWIDIVGEEYFTTQIPGFIWKGTTNIFTARDMFMRNKGRLLVSLFSVYNIVDAQGAQYNEGELLRWLSESVWFPTNLLPSKLLTWEAIDANTAKLNYNYNGWKLYFRITFNAKGEIVQMETKRFMDKAKLETWVIKASNYKEMNGVKVPTIAQAIWRLADGDYPYANFKVTSLEYDIPEIY